MQSRAAHMELVDELTTRLEALLDHLQKGESAGQLEKNHEFIGRKCIDFSGGDDFSASTPVEEGV